LDDSWSRFWERLIVDGVIVAVAGFLLQGLWFALVSLLVSRNPALESSLDAASSRGMAIWIGAVGLGLVVAFIRALGALSEPRARR
jgi:hypothetical protein